MSSRYLYKKSSEAHYTIAIIDRYLEKNVDATLEEARTQTYHHKLRAYRNPLRDWLEKYGHVTPSTLVTHPITGITRSCDGWAKKLGSKHHTAVSKRLNEGWSLIDSLERPISRTRTTEPRLWGTNHDPNIFRVN